MATPDVETDMATYLGAQSGSHTLGTDLFAGPERPSNQVPMVCTFIQAFGGRFDHHNDGPFPRAQFQVTVRGARDDYTATEATARAIHDIFKLVEGVTINSQLYTWIRATAPGPTPIGPTPDDAEFFVETFECAYEDLT